MLGFFHCLVFFIVWFFNFLLLLLFVSFFLSIAIYRLQVTTFLTLACNARVSGNSKGPNSPAALTFSQSKALGGESEKKRERESERE
jgi:hypothetical protein